MTGFHSNCLIEKSFTGIYTLIWHDAKSELTPQESKNFDCELTRIEYIDDEDQMDSELRALTDKYKGEK
jgi:hypothetical protein